MSDFGDEIIARLGENTNLAKPNNPMGKLLDYTVGEWLQQIDDSDFIEQLFLQESTGKHLDLHGKNFGVKRKVDESDENYRNRIIYEGLGHLTIDFLIDVYNVKLYSFVDGFNVNNNDLTSDNPYLSDNGFMAVADSNTKTILNRKFVLDNTVVWL